MEKAGLNAKEERPSSHKWPWWEPYVFTTGIVIVLITVMVMMSIIGRIQFFDHICFALMTLCGIVEVFRRSRAVPSLVGNTFAMLVSVVASIAYLSTGQNLLAAGYATFGGIWFLLSTHAYFARQKSRQETDGQLRKAIDSLRPRPTQDGRK